MEPKTKKCQNCKTEFEITDKDKGFYKKMDVPEPTWCPDCRLQRRMAFRNERSLYKRKCSATGKDVISIYSPDKSYTVYDYKHWWSDAWDPMNYGQEYNFKKPFFEQFRELMSQFPRPSLYQKAMINSPYANHCDQAKNAYFCVDTAFSENIIYSNWIINGKDLADDFFVFDSELTYQSQYCKKIHKGIYLIHSDECLNSAFLYDCRNCQNCFGCTNLRNKKYCIFNKQYTKEEYSKKIKKFNLGSYKTFSEIKEKFFEDILLKNIRKYAFVKKTINSTGDNLSDSKNLKNCFDLQESQDCAYCFQDWSIKDCYDAYEAAFNCELQYETHACNRCASTKFTSISYDNHHIDYCDICHNCSDLFGCIGLRKKQYCILNKQYSKEEYEELIPKIKKHMDEMSYTDKEGRVYKYGEFFPIELSPFSYNETVAHDYFSLTKKQVEEEGYQWKESEAKDLDIDIKTADLPDNIKDVDKSVIGKIIECEHQGKCNEQCVTAFRIIPQELDFYKNMNLPLPRLCPNCRHHQRLKQRNPLKLWHRKCMKKGCDTEFETSYAPDRKEIVYCEECYNKEVN